MEDDAADESRPSGQRPGSPYGSRAAVVSGDEPRPPAAWAPAVLAAHLVLLGLVAGVSILLLAGGVHTVTLDSAGQRTGPPVVVAPAAWGIAIVTVALVIRAVGRRPLERLGYWLCGTACWFAVPLAWMTVASAASAPEGAVWYLLVFASSPVGWLFLVPSLTIGAAWTGVLATMKS